MLAVLRPFTVLALFLDSCYADEPFVGPVEDDSECTLQLQAVGEAVAGTAVLL